MKWQKARDEAQRLVDRMQFRNAEISGKLIDIGPIMEHCRLQGDERERVSQAVERLLRSRGANVARIKRE